MIKSKSKPAINPSLSISTQKKERHLLIGKNDLEKLDGSENCIETPKMLSWLLIKMVKMSPSK